MNKCTDRRSFFIGLLKVYAIGLLAPVARGQTTSKTAMTVPIADMHSHLGILERQKFSADLATEMRTYGAKLVSWKLVADAPWLLTTATGIEQKLQPQPSELWAYFEKRIAEMSAYARQNNLGIVRTVSDLDVALNGGHPSVILASEGADFLGGQISLLPKAFDLGIRHLQLVHYIHSPVGDFSTEAPVHGGLTAMGKDLIRACEDKGILVDLAHCSESAIQHALEVTTKPMVWSHGWVEGDGGSYRDRYGFQRRRLSITQARQIADRGGVVGLWGFGLDRPSWGWSVTLRDRAGYARELVKLVNLIGSDAVAFGTDLAGVGNYWSVGGYGDVRQVVQFLEEQKMPMSVIEKVTSLNFYRVLQSTLPIA